MEKPKKSIPLSSPDITDLEKKLVLEVLNTSTLSRGSKTKQFEEMMADYIGVPYSLAVNSGTSALHLAIKSLGLNPGDEVITSSLSFVATSNALLMERLIPVFVDIEPSSYNLNPNLIEEKITNKTKAILPIDIFGYPFDMNPIHEIADSYGLRIVEDACNAIGAKIHNERAGSDAEISTLAFYPNKQITTGEGGMILTHDKDLYDRMKSFRVHGNVLDPISRHIVCNNVGYNYHMDEMSAALGIGQMMRIEEILGKRKKVAQMYTERLRDVEGVSLRPKEPSHIEVSWFIYPLRIHNNRDGVMSKLRENGIESKEYFPSIHLQPLYRREFGYKEGDLPITEKITSQNVALPFHNNLKEEDIDYVVDILKKSIKK